MISVSERAKGFTATPPTKIRRIKMSEALPPAPEEVENPGTPDPVSDTPDPAPEDGQEAPSAPATDAPADEDDA